MTALTISLVICLVSIPTPSLSVDLLHGAPTQGDAVAVQDRKPPSTGNERPQDKRSGDRDRSRGRGTGTGTGNSDTPRGGKPTDRHDDSDRAQRAGWVILFDGSTLDQWRGFKQEEMPAGWVIRDGALCRVEAAGDIVTREQYENFDLRLEWKIAPGGNSGIFWRASEDRNYVWETAPEMQILDNEAHRDGLDPTTSAGADYALYAPARAAAKPAGEWNEVRILVQGPKVTYWLNGQRIVHYELWSEEWEQRVKASKFASMAGYGRNTKGHIALQDHGDEVCFRNIRIRELPPDAETSRGGN